MRIQKPNFLKELPVDLKKLNNKILRGGFCTVWVAATILGFEEFLASFTVDPDNPIYLIRAACCFFILIIAAYAHSSLISQCPEK